MDFRYKTEQRKIIMNFLEENKDKFVNAEEIMKYLKMKECNVGLTTIYRFLNSLEKNNDLRIETKNHTKYYQYIDNKCDNHFYLKCKNCGKTIHLECREFNEANNHIKNKHKFSLDKNTIIYGECDNCSK